MLNYAGEGGEEGDGSMVSLQRGGRGQQLLATGGVM